LSKSTKPRGRAQLTKAEIKAYEARRASESRRALIVPDASATPGVAPTARRSYALTRDEEYVIIRSDLRRLLMILAVLIVVLIGCAIFLR
jgi:hypothetical protein